MLKVGKQNYINLDTVLPLASLPDLTNAITKSYDLIKQNTWQRTLKINGEQNQCNWLYKKKELKTAQDFFTLEVENKTLAPMWILDLTTTKSEELNLYDSVKTPIEKWNDINFRSDLPDEWSPMITWLKELSCFQQIGRTSLIISRPGIPTQYHRDIGVSDNDFSHYEHRQEFIWLNLTPGKKLYILNHKNQPTLVESSSAFFNHHNWHGCHESLQQWSFSFKIEGIFRESFRKEIGLTEELYSKELS